MADITAELEEILKAIKGEDVRQSIYRGLLKMNNQVINNGALVDGLNDVLVEQTGVDISAFEQYRPGVSISIVNANSYLYMLPGRLYKVTNNDTTIWHLNFTVDLPHPFIPSANDYTVTLRTLGLGLTMYAIDSSGFKVLWPDVLISNGTPGSDVLSYSATLSAYRDKIHVQVDLDETSPIVASLTGNYAVCFMHPAAFNFKVDEASAT